MRLLCSVVVVVVVVVYSIRVVTAQRTGRRGYVRVGRGCRSVVLRVVIMIMISHNHFASSFDKEMALYGPFVFGLFFVCVYNK